MPVPCNSVRFYFPNQPVRWSPLWIPTFFRSHTCRNYRRHFPNQIHACGPQTPTTSAKHVRHRGPRLWPALWAHARLSGIIFPSHWGPTRSCLARKASRFAGPLSRPQVVANGFPAEWSRRQMDSEVCLSLSLVEKVHHHIWNPNQPVKRQRKLWWNGSKWKPSHKSVKVRFQALLLNW